jgi:hypothetical protein
VPVPGGAELMKTKTGDVMCMGGGMKSGRGKGPPAESPKILVAVFLLTLLNETFKFKVSVSPPVP